MNLGQEGNAPVNDRLVSTLFITALFHGIVIVGVTFTSPDPPPEPEMPSLEVVLVMQNEEAEAPEDARHLAQTNQAGAGNTEEYVAPASSALSPMPVPVAGNIEGNDLIDSDPGQTMENPNMLVSRDAERQIESVPETSVQPDQVRRIAMEMTASEIDSVALDRKDTETRVHGDSPRELVVSVDTKEAIIADYLVSWRQKVEKVGMLDMPEEVFQGEMLGSPTVEVAILPNGLIHEVIVRKSSGHKPLDQAAYRSIRLAAPFDPLPAAVREQYDVLRFVYDWNYKKGSAAQTPIHVSENTEDS